MGSLRRHEINDQLLDSYLEVRNILREVPPDDQDSLAALYRAGRDDGLAPEVLEKMIKDNLPREMSVPFLERLTGDDIGA